MQSARSQLNVRLIPISRLELRVNMTTKALLLVMVMVLGAASIAMAWPPWKDHMSVNIINDVGGTPFNVHCKSRDDDLGLQTVLPHQTFGFGFYPNVLGTTLFSCTFHWGSFSQGFIVWRDIGIWGKQSKLCRQCVYLVHGPEGFWRSEGPAGPFHKICDWKL